MCGFLFTILFNLRIRNKIEAELEKADIGEAILK